MGNSAMFQCGKVFQFITRIGQDNEISTLIETDTFIFNRRPVIQR